MITKGVSLRSWNKNQLAAIAINTTGVTPGYHELIEVAIIPSTNDFVPRTDVLPFHMYIFPLHPDRSTNKDAFEHARCYGVSKELFVECLERWVEKLNLPLTFIGKKEKRLMLLGHELNKVILFMKHILGFNGFYEKFHEDHRDLVTIRGLLNDHNEVKSRKVKYPKFEFSNIARREQIYYDKKRPLERANAMLRTYRRILYETML